MGPATVSTRIRLMNAEFCIGMRVVTQNTVYRDCTLRVPYGVVCYGFLSIIIPLVCLEDDDDDGGIHLEQNMR